MTNMSNDCDYKSNQFGCSKSEPGSSGDGLGFVTILSLSEQIKNVRKRLGMSQREFAKELGITQAQLCRLETKPNTRPTRKTLKALVPYLGKSYSELLAGAGYSGNVHVNEEFYDKSGDPINIMKIMEELFQTDPELIGYLNGISYYGTQENLEVLKIMLQTMKKIEGGEEESDLMKKSFQYLKEYILKLLSLPVTI